MTITFDTSTLLAWYQAKTGVPLTGSTTSGASTAPVAPAKPTVPTPPWQAAVSTSKGASTSTSQSALTQAALAGASVVNPGGAKLDAPGVADANDYKSLFTLYQSLGTLQDLAKQAGAKGLSSSQQAQYTQAFTRGLSQVQTYLDGSPFKQFQVAQTANEALAKSAGGTPLETDTYTTAAIYAGAASDEVPAFQGDVRFSLTATSLSGVSTPVSFDLSELGDAPRTIGNVVNYLNGKLAAAGLATRFADVLTPGLAQTITAGGKSFTLPTGPDQYALKIVGTPTESLTFSAPASTAAAYLVGGVAGPTSSTGATASAAADPAPTEQLIKLDAGSSADPAAAPVFRDALAAQVAAARAVATAPDGSVYALEDVTGPTGGQAIQGAQDVALVKYDSAGNVVFTRTLGAAASASGYALSVSADGSKVALSGSVTGALDPSSPPASATTADSFVSVFSAAGDEQWTGRLSNPGGATQASAVAVQNDGSAYVVGTTQAALPGQADAGGQDGFLQGLSATGTTRFTTEFGGAGVDKPAGVVLDGNSVVVAGVENGHAVARRYDLQAQGAPTLGAVRDLGDLQGGGVAGLATLPDGSLVLAGSTHNGALDAGTPTRAYDGGADAFVAKLSADLGPSSSDALTYVGGGADRTVSGLTVSGGQVYLTGQVTAPPPPGSTSAEDGYALALDPTTGATGWSGRVAGAGGTEAPTGIAVVQGGASVLDRLGLPTGAISYAQPTTLEASTSVRPGDEFFVRSGGGAATAVTIAAGETLQSLALKITRASGFNLTVSVLPSGGSERLQIAPASQSAKVEIEAGPNGRNALGALGLTEGVVQTAAPTTKPAIGTPSAYGRRYSLNLPSNLDVSTTTGATAAQGALASAIAQVQLIYTSLTTPVAAPSAGGAGSTVPAYLTAQIANYQAALSRLTGTSGS